MVQGFNQNKRFIQLFTKDAASELGDATDVTYTPHAAAEPGQGNCSTLKQKLCSLQPVVVFSGLYVN